MQSLQGRAALRLPLFSLPPSRARPRRSVCACVLTHVGRGQTNTNTKTKKGAALAAAAVLGSWVVLASPHPASPHLASPGERRARLRHHAVRGRGPRLPLPGPQPARAARQAHRALRPERQERAAHGAPLSPTPWKINERCAGGRGRANAWCQTKVLPQFNLNT